MEKPVKTIQYISVAEIKDRIGNYFTRFLKDNLEHHYTEDKEEIFNYVHGVFYQLCKTVFPEMTDDTEIYTYIQSYIKQDDNQHKT